MKFEPFSDLHKDFVIGSMLGDGYLDCSRKTAILVFQHGVQQKDYCNEKYELLKDYCNSSIKYNVCNAKSRNKKYFSYKFATRAIPELNDYKGLSVIDQLNKLNENSFTIWMLDDGSLEQRSKNSYRYTITARRFSEDETLYAIKIFKEKFGLTGLLQGKTNTGKIRFKASDSKKISEIMRNSEFGYMAENCMSYKLIHEVEKS